MSYNETNMKPVMKEIIQ